MTETDFKTIVITGVSRGLGRAMAAGFAAAGHTVIGCATNALRLGELETELAGSHDFQAVDISDDAQVARWAADVISRYGAPDFVLNNAALMNQPNTLWNVPAAEFDRLIDVNIKGTANVVRHFVPAMIDQGRGVVVNFSSGWGRMTSPEVGPYCASKFAVEGLTRALSQELPRGLAAVALSPGVIDTDMLRVAWGDGAASHPSPDKWKPLAIAFILALTAANNGESLTIA
jgi:NAD(P)-dependent dehydrogenase (short-subunit alcohol dehydrogenase family)